MDKTLPGGLLIAIEGIDGAGKTTLAAALAALLRRDLGLGVVTSKEPTQGPHGMALRATAITGRLAPEDELMLLVADRREHVAQCVAPALVAGNIVLLDRYYFSNIAYQGAEGVPPDTVRAANEFAPEPHRVLLLDLPVATGLERIRARGDHANTFETAANLEVVRRLFRENLPTQGRVIDATQSAQKVLIEALGHVVSALAERIHASEGLSVASAERLRGLLFDPA